MKKSKSALTGLFASAATLMLVSGCARVATNDQQKPAWGPIVGSSVPEQTPPRQQFVVINQAQLGRGLPAVFSTGAGNQLKIVTKTITTTKAGASQTTSSSQLSGIASPTSEKLVGVQSEPLPRVESAPATATNAVQEAPFGHRAAKLALPDQLPPVNEIAGEPIRDRFSLDTSPSAVPSLTVKPETASTVAAESASTSAAESAPKPIVFPNHPVQTTKPTSVPQPARARLAEPTSNIAPLKPSQVKRTLELPKTTEVAALSTTAKLNDYRFSFSNEIWLMIIILGGVFATLWFRLEYDFGTKTRHRRR